eukprot:TRINITY_DN894_c1_g1_i1.p1 TRINITY_DN894_c1_g1~~TRINITY_DN894_c1_g1_i1.p1  ORF type:complete len:478 (+),score=54.63 TRINITY_DN894_c1_g1_i1:64-1434(+)
MENDLLDVLTAHRISPEADRRAITCMQKLEGELGKIGPQWQVRAFGSFANGMCMEGSDLDATCYSSKKDEEVNSRTTMELLLRLKELLESHPDFLIVDFVASARVPILKLRYDASLDVDLSCNNTEPFPNTQLLRAYTNLSPIARDLLLLIKCWAKGAGVVGAKDGHLSSYSFALMTIYFLQVDSRINMPCFPIVDFTGEVDIPPSARFAWSLNMYRSSLLHMFFNFYAFEFQWNDEVIAMHVGQRTDKYNPIHSQLKDIWESRLHVADPFLSHRNLNCVLKPENELLLFKQIQGAASEMHAGMLPTGLRNVFQRSQWRLHQSIPPQVSQQMVPYSGNFNPPAMQSREPRFMPAWANNTLPYPNVPPQQHSSLPQSVATRGMQARGGGGFLHQMPPPPPATQLALMGKEPGNANMAPKAKAKSKAAAVAARSANNNSRVVAPSVNEIPFTKLAQSY